MMKQYKCALCDYQTNQRNRIHIHHIIPRESGGNNKKYNLVMLCPNHHNKIYSDYASHGIHTNQNDSIQITGWFMSSAGRVLGYIDQNGNEQFIGI